MIGRLVYALVMRLPHGERMKLAKWRFQKVRETFYDESRLDIEATKGLRNREIAEQLGVTEGTVKAYVHAIFEKLGVNNRTELAIRADEFLAG